MYSISQQKGWAQAKPFIQFGFEILEFNSKF
jgi:hypothetical protein